MKYMQQYLSEHPHDQVGAILAGMQKTGKVRDVHTKQSLLKAYRTVINVVQALGDNTETAVASLETKGYVTAQSFRSWRRLLTPHWRQEAARFLITARPTLQQMDNYIAGLVQRQWMNIHWRRQNNNLNPAPGVHTTIHPPRVHPTTTAFSTVLVDFCFLSSAFYCVIRFA